MHSLRATCLGGMRGSRVDMALAWRAGLTGADSTAGPSLGTQVGRVTPQKHGELLSRGSTLRSKPQRAMRLVCSGRWPVP